MAHQTAPILPLIVFVQLDIFPIQITLNGNVARTVSGRVRLVRVDCVMNVFSFPSTLSGAVARNVTAASPDMQENQLDGDQFRLFTLSF